MATLMQQTGDGRYQTMLEAPYAAETDLQALLADHPHLLGADAFEDETERRWILVRREMAVDIEDTEGTSTGWVDHLFVDQEGIATIVEVKRASNTESRRKIVGQILDYAANAPHHWTADVLRSAFETAPPPAGEGPKPPRERLARLLGTDEPDADAFWKLVEQNLHEGRLRIVFVLDRVPTALLRIVEFLNKHLDTVETYALEVRRHAVSESAPPILEVSRRGVSASNRPQAARPRHPVLSMEDWEERFQRRHGDVLLAVAQAVVDCMSKHGHVFVTKSGDPSVGLHVPGPGTGRYPIFIKANGRISITFTYLMQRPEFADESMRAEVARRILDIVGDRGRYGGPTGDLTIELEPLRDEGVRERMLAEVEKLVARMTSVEVAS